MNTNYPRLTEFGIPKDDNSTMMIQNTVMSCVSRIYIAFNNKTWYLVVDIRVAFTFCSELRYTISKLMLYNLTLFHIIFVLH